MAKRNLSRQQQRRIASKQKSKIDDELKLDESSSQTARVVSHHGRQLYAETRTGERIKCKIRQNLGDIACGDYVVIQHPVSEQQNDCKTRQNVVVAIKERKNLLVKTGFAGAVKPVAANIDQLVIVTAVKPKPNPYLIDRYLTSAENLPADAIIVINKTDLLDHESKRRMEDMIERYSSIGYRVISTSIKQDMHTEQLADALADSTSILVGLSGVGKSSIVKALLPKEEIRIGETSDATGEGKHTTTVSALYHLKNNGIVIDSPGVRDFTPINNSIAEITNGFIDVRQFDGYCKFSNCTHHNEPQCAMRAAVAEGQLDQQRFENYLRLIEEFNQP